MEGLPAQVSEQQEAVRRLHDIREAEEEVESWFQAQSAVDQQPMAKQPKIPSQQTQKGGDSNTEWKFARARQQGLVKSDKSTNGYRICVTARGLPMSLALRNLVC